MKRTFFLLVFMIFGLCSKSQIISQDDIDVVQDFVKYVKQDLRERIASEGHFPMRRQYPIPPVADSSDFLKRYSEIFDRALIEQITNSKVPDDWSHVGWRGIMLENGVLWLEEGGGVKAVNYQSKFEKGLRTSLIEKDRSTLHPTIQDYLEPRCIVETNTYRIRVDKYKDGTYRYTSWKKGAEISSIPELQITKGTLIFEGRGGNHRYLFTNGDFRYEIEVLLIGSDDEPPARLIVYKANEEILSQSALIEGD